MPIQTRIFLGYIQNKEIARHLLSSSVWREAKIVGENRLEETEWEGKVYIGLFLPSLLNCAQIQEQAGEVKRRLLVYCPKLNVEKYPPFLLSQLFVT